MGAEWDEAAELAALEKAKAEPLSYSERLTHGSRVARDNHLQEEFDKKKESHQRSIRVANRADGIRTAMGGTYAEQRGKGLSQGATVVEEAKHPAQIEAEARELQRQYDIDHPATDDAEPYE